MINPQSTLLLLGESDVGKTHYGAQVLRRLNSGLGTFSLADAANLIPFRTALEKIRIRNARYPSTLASHSKADIPYDHQVTCRNIIGMHLFHHT